MALRLQFHSKYPDDGGRVLVLQDQSPNAPPTGLKQYEAAGDEPVQMGRQRRGEATGVFTAIELKRFAGGAVGETPPTLAGRMGDDRVRACVEASVAALIS